MLEIKLFKHAPEFVLSTGYDAHCLLSWHIALSLEWQGS